MEILIIITYLGGLQHTFTVNLFKNAFNKKIEFIDTLEYVIIENHI